MTALAFLGGMNMDWLTLGLWLGIYYQIPHPCQANLHVTNISRWF